MFTALSFALAAEPQFVVVNKTAPAFTVVNKTAPPERPVRIEPLPVFQRPVVVRRPATFYYAAPGVAGNCPGGVCQTPRR